MRGGISITRVFVVDENNLSALSEPAAILRAGGTVAFPTETVYGLGANALDSQAVKKIFLAKGRPQDNPLIVHLAEIKDVAPLVRDFPQLAQRAAQAFWPGPFTMVLPKNDLIPREVSAGLDTVALRVPAHPVALALIKMAGVPVAAPSANLSGRPSPTTARHVLMDLGEKIDAVVDGGPCQVGLESTVVDFTVHPPVLLRPGGITLEELEKVLGKVHLDPAVFGEMEALPRAPGMKYTHYAPRAPLILIEGEEEGVRKKMMELAKKHQELGQRVFLLEPGEFKGDLSQAAAKLYGRLREFDEEGAQVIIAGGFPAQGIGLALMNRLRKAATTVIRV